ncbi:MAG TPA: CPBP family intramembrane glutamic endopeptidase [Roseiflexaceae bacterium]|nr:CPBP family intramembrane glutamic endopeptidase [Roseiflexaceae bacterium]
MIYEATSSAKERSASRLPSALGLVLAVVVVEYLARRFALFWLPAIGTLRVNDMLVTAVAYFGLVGATVPAEQRNPAALGATLRQVLAEGRRWQPWVAALLVVGLSLLALVDLLLWGEVRLPVLMSPWRWDAVVLEAAAPVLVPLSVLIVNGWVIPLAEEWLWRGLIQPSLVGRAGAVAGVLVTSVLFSLKHAIVDASLGRLLMITAFGLVMGVLALRRGWRASALAHALANTTASVLALVAGGGQM